MNMNKILVVNNDMDTMSLIQQALQLRGYDVKYTGNKQEIESLLTSFSPDVLVIDILQMPSIEHSGAVIREQNIDILMMTGYNNQEDAAVRSPGSYIKKPFTIQQLQQQIEAILLNKKRSA